MSMITILVLLELKIHVKYISLIILIIIYYYILNNCSIFYTSEYGKDHVIKNEHSSSKSIKWTYNKELQGDLDENTQLNI